MRQIILLIFIGLFSCKRFEPAATPVVDPPKKLLLFTGSSSVRIWKTLAEDFPDYETINTGFGGSQFSDLIESMDTVIFSYQPDVLFIYEGDNDIALRKTPEEVERDAQRVLEEVRLRLPSTQVVLIGAKPSPSRWRFAEKYEDLNTRLIQFATNDPMVHYADVWTLMLKENGRVRGDIFISDSLHMNAEGYKLWTQYLNEVLKEKCGL